MCTGCCLPASTVVLEVVSTTFNESGRSLAALYIPSAGTTASIDLSRCFNTEIKEAEMEYPLWGKIDIDRLCTTSRKNPKGIVGATKQQKSGNTRKKKGEPGN